MKDIKLSDLNRKFSVLLEHFDGGVLIEDEARRIAFVNKKFCRMFSVPLEPEQLLGYDCSRAVGDSAHLFKDPAGFVNKTYAILSACRPVSGQQLAMSDGRILEREFIPVMADDRVEALIWLYRDVSKYTSIESSLKYRLAFEELITNLSYSFITSRIDHLDRAIENSLEDIGRFVNADRSYVFMFNKDLTIMSNTHEWCGAGITAEKANLQQLPTSIFPWWMDKLTSFESIVLNSLSVLPEEAVEEREILEVQGIKSLAVVPLVYSYELLGYLGFDSVRSYKQWDSDSVMLLRVFGNILTGALRRKENELFIRGSQKRYKQVVDNLTEVIFQTDKDGNWMFLNPAWEAITGFTFGESIGQPFLNFVHPDDRQRNQELFLPLINREKEYCRHQVRYLKKDGSYCWVEVFAKLTFDESEQIVGTSGTLNDITQRKVQEDEIRKLSKAVESTPTAVILTDLNGEIVFVNKGLLKIGKYDCEEQVLHRMIFDFTDNAGKEKLVSEVLPILMKGLDWQGEMEVVRADGSLLPVTMICSVVKDEQNNPQYLLSNFFDISEMKRAEADIRKAFLKEKEVSELKSRFVSLVSHEFRTPLAAILSSAEILEYYSAKFTPEQKEQQYQKIKNSINNLLDILNEVSEINRIDLGKVTPIPASIPADGFLKDMLEEIEAGYKSRPEIIVNNSCGSLELTADKKLLRQVMMNIISNAIKYTPENKKVTVSTYKQDGGFVFEVADQGIGIPEKDQERIFEPFTRSDKVQNIKGTGLGLNIARKAAELLGGSITFTSREGEGSTFKVIIPLKAENA